MSNKRISTKKLKAIVFTDIVDFTKISAKDEQNALDIIDKQRNLLKPIVLEHKGEWLKEIGDGLLLSFDSSLDAVQCSIEIQKTLKNIIEFQIRIGVHQGDIFIKDGDVYGDDVNIASRIESFAPIGGITLSDKVKKDIQSVSKIKTDFIGHRKLKGVQQETKISCVTSNDLPKNKDNIIPKSVAYVNLFMGYQSLVFCIIFILTSIFKSFNGVEISDELVQKIIIKFKESIVFLLIGYSCLSFYKGISIKSQKAIYYFGIINGIYYLFNETITKVFKFFLSIPKHFLSLKNNWLERIEIMSLDDSLNQSEKALLLWSQQNLDLFSIILTTLVVLIILFISYILPIQLMKFSRYIIDLMKLKNIIK